MINAYCSGKSSVLNWNCKRKDEWGQFHSNNQGRKIKKILFREVFQPITRLTFSMDNGNDTNMVWLNGKYDGIGKFR